MGKKSRPALVLHGGWAKGGVHAVTGVAPWKCFKLVTVLIQFAFWRDLPGTRLRRLSGWGKPCSPPQAFLTSTCAPLERAPGAEGSPARHAGLRHVLLLLDNMPSHGACSAEKQVWGRDKGIKSRRTKLILGAGRHGGLSPLPSKCHTWFWPRDPDERKPGLLRWNAKWRS